MSSSILGGGVGSWRRGGGTEAAGWKAGGGAWRLEPICGIVTQPTSKPALELIGTAEVGGGEGGAKLLS